LAAGLYDGLDPLAGLLVPQPQYCIKKMEKTSPKAMCVEFTANPGRSLEQTGGAAQDRFGFYPSFLPFGKAVGLQIRRCQGLAVALLRRHPWRLVSEALRLLQHWGQSNGDMPMTAGAVKAVACTKVSLASRERLIC
jgi:hypothetical protein